MRRNQILLQVAIILLPVLLHLKVAPYSRIETAAKNKVVTMTQNICYLCEMGVFLEVETLA
jgi:hypothetical protein